MHIKFQKFICALLCTGLSLIWLGCDSLPSQADRDMTIEKNNGQVLVENKKALEACFKTEIKKKLKLRYRLWRMPSLVDSVFNKYNSCIGCFPKARESEVLDVEIFPKEDNSNAVECLKAKLRDLRFSISDPRYDNEYVYINLDLFSK